MSTLKKTLQFIRAIYVFLYCILQSYFPPETTVYDREWDLLIILDACRTDALAEVAEEYDFITDVTEVTSVASTSSEFVHNTFTEDHLSDIRSTSYVTCNPYSNQVRTENVNRLETYETMGTIFENESIGNHIVRNNTVGGEFASFKLAEGMKINGESSRTCYPPDVVTARAIETAREEGVEKMIVHYMQPHAPYFSDALERGYYEAYEEYPFNYLRNDGDKSVVWEAYLDTLRAVLDSVKILLENVDAETAAITADHGELFGEWGLYSHPYGIPHPKLRNVPWVETTAQDRQTTSADELLSSYDGLYDNDNIEERLSALGYI